MNASTKSHVRSLVLCALFAALIALGAFLRIPMPGIPFTLQVFFVVLAGLLLGPKLGAVSALVYLVVGLLGVPVFTGGGGPGYVLQPTFGYLLGFVLGAWLAGWIAGRVEKPRFGRLFLACLAAMGVIYAIGLCYYAVIVQVYLGKPLALSGLLMTGVVLVAPGDLVCCVLACFLVGRLKAISAVRALLPQS